MSNREARNEDKQEDRQKGLLSFKALRPYLSLLRGQTRDMSLALFLMIMSTAVSLAIPVFSGRFVDAFSQGLTSGPKWQHLTILGLLLILQLIGTFFSTVISARLGLRTVTRLRQRIFDHLLELPVLFFAGQKAGDLSSRVTSDVGSIQYMVTNGIVSIVRALLTLTGALFLMFHMNTRLTTVVLLLIPATILLVRLFGSRLQKLSRKMYDELGRISSHVQETVGGISSLKVYNNQSHEAGRFQGTLKNYLDAGIRRSWLEAALESGIQLSLWICLIGVMIYGFILAAQGQATGGQLVAFLLLAFRVAMPLASLTGLYASGQGAVAAAGRLGDIFNLPTERIPGTPRPQPICTPGAIDLEGVHFSYPSSEEHQLVLRDMTISIPAGQWIGIVGPSGGGKTTLAGLLMGLFPPTQGRLLLDGKPYAEIELGELRSRMAYVAQDPVLYDLSLEENIRFGLTDVSHTEVRRAAEQAGVLEFADRLPSGLGTITGERGVRLSGGQRQRISLARAFLRNPGILVLDEPTSALDAAAEENIRTSLRSLMQGRTALVIAHRLSLVRDLHKIFVLADGQIAECGSHQELMAKGGLYRTLYDLQQGDV